MNYQHGRCYRNGKLALHHHNLDKQPFDFAIVNFGTFDFVGQVDFIQPLLVKVKVDRCDLNGPSHSNGYHPIAKDAAPPQPFFGDGLSGSSSGIPMIVLRVDLFCMFDRD